MNLYQNLKVILNPDYPGFQEALIELVENSEGWSIRKARMYPKTIIPCRIS